MYVLKRIGVEQKESIKDLFASVFMNEPWNDDWSDPEQLDLYIMDLIEQSNCLTYGFYEEDELIGISLGFIKHWYTGTEYVIDELCIRRDKQGSGTGTHFLKEIEKAIKELGLKQIFLQTDTEVPAYKFYKKNGFTELTTHVSFAKGVI